MGNKHQKETTLKTKELNEFHNMTLFSHETLIKLYEHYRHFCAVQTDDGVIDFDEFCIILNKQDKNLTKRIFNTIDANLDGCINFREFLKFISCFINGTIEEQISLSFKIYSNPETKTIEPNTMCDLIKDIVTAEESLCKFFNNELIELVVKETFKKIGGEENKAIGFDNYKEMIKNYPDILNWLKMDLERIKNVKFQNKMKKTKSCLG